MDLVKNKYGIAFLLIVAAAAIHYFFFYEKCEQPDQMTIAQTQLYCAENVDIAAFKVELCKKIYDTEDCVLNEERDFDTAQKLFLDKVNECAKQELKKNNLCVDKYEDIK